MCGRIKLQKAFMAGHSKWKQIKHKKAAADKARGNLFSKLANNIAIAAKKGIDPQFNPSLRSAIDQAKKQNMPQANIDRAINRASEKNSQDSLLVEIYGPGGIGVLVRAKTDNKNRTMGEIKMILKKKESRLAEQGGVSWAFEKTPDGYVPKFENPTTDETKNKIVDLVESLKENPDVVDVYSAVDL